MTEDETFVTKTLNLSSPEGGSYVIVISLTKEHESAGGDHVVPAHLWNFVSRRDYYLLRGNEPEPELDSTVHGSMKKSRRRPRAGWKRWCRGR